MDRVRAGAPALPLLVTLAHHLTSGRLVPTGNEEIITSTHFSGLLDQCSKLANAACLTGCLPHSGSSIKGSCAFSFIFFPHPDILEPPSFSAWFNLSAQLAQGRLCLLSFLAEPQSRCGFSLGLFHPLSGSSGGWGRSPCPDTTFSCPSQCLPGQPQAGEMRPSGKEKKRVSLGPGLLGFHSH